ncbi:hypothetical protein AKO1_015000 [Acrasis kona]|uniref:VASt domain-containing protein n=1 Tax=Acrasis kona TaxID=1008807 RepID=A0AAW2Z2W7_9EUKA
MAAPSPPKIIITAPTEPAHMVPDYLDKLDQLDTDQHNDIFQTTVKMTPVLQNVTFPVSTDEFFSLVYGNQSPFMKQFHDSLHDLHVEIDEWNNVNHTGEAIARCVMYKLDQKSEFGQLFTKPMANMLQTDRLALTRNKSNNQTCMSLHSSIASQNLVPTEMFQIEIKYFIIDTRKSTSSRKECKLDVLVGANCRGAFFRTSAESSVIKAQKKRIELWLTMVRRCISDHHKTNMDIRYDQERLSLEASILAAMKKYENPQLTSTHLLPEPPLLNSSPPPSPRQRAKLKEMFTESELNKPEKPLPMLNTLNQQQQQQSLPSRESGTFNHRYVKYSAGGESEAKFKNQFIQGYSWHDDSHVDVVNTPTTPMMNNVELVDMLANKNPTNHHLFDPDAPPKPLTSSQDKKQPSPPAPLIVPSSPAERAAEESGFKMALNLLFQYLQIIVGVLIEAVSVTLGYVRNNASSAIVFVVLFSVAWGVYYNVQLSRETNRLRSELKIRMEESSAQYALARELLKMTGDDQKYDYKSVHKKILMYLIKNNKMNEQQGVNLDDLLDVLRTEFVEE